MMLHKIFKNHMIFFAHTKKDYIYLLAMTPFFSNWADLPLPRLNIMLYESYPVRNEL